MDEHQPTSPPLHEAQPHSPTIEDRIVTHKGEDEEARLRRKLLDRQRAVSVEDPGPPAPPPPKEKEKKHKRHKHRRHSPIRAPPEGGRVPTAEDEDGELFSMQPVRQESQKHRKHKDKHRLRPEDEPPRRDRDRRRDSPEPRRADDRYRGDRRDLPDDRRSTSASSHSSHRDDRRGLPLPPPSSDRSVRSSDHGSRSRRLPPAPPSQSTRSHDMSRSRSPHRREREERVPGRRRDDERLPPPPPRDERPRKEEERSRPERRVERLVRDPILLPPEPMSSSLSSPKPPRGLPLPRGPDSGSSPGSSSTSDGEEGAASAAESGELSDETGERRRADESQESAEAPPQGKTKSKFESSSESEAEEDGPPPDSASEEEENGKSEAVEVTRNGASPEHKDVDGLIADLEGASDGEPEPMEEELPEGVVPTNLLPTYFAGISGCRSVEEFHCLNRIEEGTYGVVYRAKEKRTDEVVALKRLKMEKEKEGFPITSLREINMLLKAGGHENVVNIREIVVGTNMDKIYLCMDYVEHDMKSLMESMKQPFLIGEVKTLLRQLLAGIHHLHDNWILHRDLKTSNLLLSHQGDLKIGDFGLAREYGSPIKPYTPVVVTLWYRAPELLLGVKEYSTDIDMWSVGCIFAEFLTLKPIFPGRGELDELNRIFKTLGTPSEQIWPGYSDLPAHKRMSFAHYPYNQLRKHFDASLSDKGLKLMNKLLTYNPDKRVSAAEALKDDWFPEEPTPVPQSMFPTWPAKSELKANPTRAAAGKLAASPKAPVPGHKATDDAAATADNEEALLLRAMNLRAAAQPKGFSLRFDAPKFH